jgi:WD40 repeat protein/tRNA A-37 threonylcarbamoyl transferase component Bud32
LDVLETYQGHSDSVWELCFDNSKVLYSASGDGSVKKWNMAARKVAYSFENRNSSVKCLAAIGNSLFVGTNNGAITSYNIDTGFMKKISFAHNNVVTSLFIDSNFIFSSGLDGFFKQTSLLNFGDEYLALYNADESPLKSLVSSMRGFFALSGDLDIIEIALNQSSRSLKKISSLEPLNTLAYADNMILASTKSGAIIAWDTQTLAKIFELKGHTYQINAMLAKDLVLYSASDDKTIIIWSLLEKGIIRTLKRTSASALGHLGSVNSITLCNGVLFSGGSDLTTRRWEIKTGRHEDVYFGLTKSVTAVLCYNGSVFSGSEDFAVIMYKPQLPEEKKKISTTVNTMTASKSKTLKIVRNTRNTGLSRSQNQDTLIIIVAVAAFILAVSAFAISCYKYKISNTPSTVLSSTGFDSSVTATATDLQTVINTVVGISKHASYIIPHGALATVRKLASGGGGELFISRVMDQRFINVPNGLVIQKIVFTSTKSVEESFFQEVGIMIMLKDFPHFCQILGYTEKPLAIVMKYYPDGSLFEWLRNNKYNNRIMVKALREISSALNTMHSYYLAHCDIKTQNVLVEVVKGIPHCYLTDFGITRILSDRILASQLFNVINLRGLSTQYASPEAFENFKTKSFGNTDFKKYDIYSFACAIYELLRKRTPWA